jgi:hypothetical protein
MTTETQTKTLELKTVWVFECIHDMEAGIFKNVVDGPNPSEDEKQKNRLYGDADESHTKQEEVLFIDGTPHFLHR